MEIQKYNGSVNSLPEMLKMADMFAASGMFADAREKGQAFVKIQAGAELGILPFQAMAGIHIIKGKPAIGSGLIAAKVKASGKYNYKVLEQTDKVCRIEFFEKVSGKFESIGISEMTIEQARKQGSQNLDRLPLNMLFARAISNGVRWHCPDVFMGSVYTPDEMGAKVNENEEPIDTEYTEVRSTPAIQAPAPKEPEPLTPEQVAEKVNALVTAFEAKGIDKLQIKVTTGKDITEINEADIATLRAMYKELIAEPAPDKFELMAKYKTIFQDAN